MAKNFMSYDDAVTVLTPYANGIKAATPIELTYEQFEALTEEEKNTGNYIVTDYPVEDVPSLTPGQISSLIGCLG